MIVRHIPALGWWNQYIGIPFRDHGADPGVDGGLNCWTLGRWVYLRELGILLPTYAEEVDPNATLAAQLGTLNTAFLAGSTAWQPVQGPHQPFDMVLMRRGRLACHVGVVIKPGRMLHIEEGVSSCLEDYAQGFWARRVVGVYRHA